MKNQIAKGTLVRIAIFTMICAALVVAALA
jgi:hypothetical protein